MDIMTLTRELGKTIQESDIYAELEAARKVNDADSALQKLIEKFGALNECYERESSKEEEADQETLEKLESEIEQLYGAIMANPNMARFELAKNNMDDLMNKIVAILAGAVNGDDPMTLDPDQLIHSGCSGNCDCCGHSCHDEDCECDEDDD